jgi:glycosyltransferase involved in cell wall biosynthesis
MDKIVKEPKVTVLMAVYNGGKYLKPSIESILSQSFKDFEFLIINDGSTDGSQAVIESYAKKDDRIRLISRANKGLIASLNEGLKKARGEYIARQDADDISVPLRLGKEVAYLDSHPSVALVGSNYAHIDTKGKKTGTITNIFTHPDDLKTALISCNQYGHGSVMMRRSIFKKSGYYEDVLHAEDYDLWARISRVADVANIEEPLYLWRKHEAGIGVSNQQFQIDQTFAIRDKAFEHFLKHRREYKLFAFHPSGQWYRDRKAILYRDLAFLYRQHGDYFKSLFMLIAAALIQPKNKRNYRFLLESVRRPRSFKWEYEWL